MDRNSCMKGFFGTEKLLEKETFCILYAYIHVHICVLYIYVIYIYIMCIYKNIYIYIYIFPAPYHPHPHVTVWSQSLHSGCICSVFCMVAAWHGPQTGKFEGFPQTNLPKTCCLHDFCNPSRTEAFVVFHLRHCGVVQSHPLVCQVFI